MLVARDIRKAFGDQEVLRGVDLAIQPGSITVVIGPSGGGKTTLLRALSLLDPPTSGTVSIDENTYIFGADKPNGLIAPPWPILTVVFQQLFLWPHLTLRENISLVLKEHANSEGSPELDTFIESFEMAEFIDRYPNEASLGQKQRTALVRAIVLKPKYLLLDEITSALDVEHVAKVLVELQRLRSDGVGIFVITHLIRFAQRAADQILFFDKGVVVEAGPPSVLENPSHERLSRFLSVIEAAT